MSTPKRIINALAIPVATLVILQTLCLVNGQSVISNMKSFDNFIVYTAIVMITTMALSINLNSGRFDFSLGSMASLSAVIGAKVTYGILSGGSGSALLMLVVSIFSGVILGLISGLAYCILKLPPIIVSLGVTLIYEGIMYTITSGKYVMTEVQNQSMSGFTGTWIYAALIMLAVLVFMIIVFDKSAFGYDYNALRSGQKVAVATGINEVKNALICYGICGGMMGIVGTLNAARNTTINGGQLNFGSIAIMFTAFLPMFIAGYIVQRCDVK